VQMTAKHRQRKRTRCVTYINNMAMLSFSWPSMLKPTLKSFSKRCVTRFYSSQSLPILNAEALDEWISSPKQLVLKDTIRPEHLSDLYITLPTRDGTRRQYQPPKSSGLVGCGHHLAFFHPRNPEKSVKDSIMAGTFMYPRALDF